EVKNQDRLGFHRSCLLNLSTIGHEHRDLLAACYVRPSGRRNLDSGLLAHFPADSILKALSWLNLAARECDLANKSRRPFVLDKSNGAPRTRVYRDCEHVHGVDLWHRRREPYVFQPSDHVSAPRVVV